MKADRIFNDMKKIYLLAPAKPPGYMPDRIYDFTNFLRIDLVYLSDFLGINMPVTQIAVRKNQPEGIVDLYLKNEHLGKFTPGDRVLILPHHVASAFAPQGDYTDFMVYVQDVRAYRSNLVFADPFYAFMLQKTGNLHLARVDDITDKLINFGGRACGYLSLVSCSQAMQ